jgi:hypothetical protein
LLTARNYAKLLREAGREDEAQAIERKIEPGRAV